jgi:hypothetical protein
MIVNIQLDRMRRELIMVLKTFVWRNPRKPEESRSGYTVVGLRFELDIFWIQVRNFAT